MKHQFYQISKKSDYAIKGLLELALQNTPEPVNVRKLADKQSIPVRFLEVILNELKQGGFVRSIRGKSGGYVLAKPAESLNIGEILGFLEKYPAIAESGDQTGSVAVAEFMDEINTAVSNVCEGITLAMLAEKEARIRSSYALDYSI